MYMYMYMYKSNLINIFIIFNAINLEMTITHEILNAVDILQRNI